MVYPEALKPLPTLMTTGSPPARMSEHQASRAAACMHILEPVRPALNPSDLVPACAPLRLTQQICSRLARHVYAGHHNRNNQWLLRFTVLPARAWRAQQLHMLLGDTLTL